MGASCMPYLFINQIFKTNMKKRATVFIIIFLSFLSIGAIAKNVLSGMVTDKKTSKPLAGASIYIEDLKIGAISNSEGSYSLKDLPRGTYVVSARFIGYA